MANNKSDLGRFFKHSGIYAIGNVLNRIGAFILLPIYTTHLSVSEYGVLELFYMISAVISGILAIGIAHATLRFYFEYENINDRNAVVSTNIITSSLIAVIGCLIVILFRDDVVNIVFGGSDNNFHSGLYIILITMILELSSQVCLSYIRARELSVFYVMLSLIKLVIQVAANIYTVIVLEAGIVGILAGNLAAVAIGWLVLMSYTLINCGVNFHLEKMKIMLTYSYPFLLGTLVGLIAMNADRFMLNKMIGLEAVGIYALAYKLTMLIDVLVAEPFSKSYGAYRFSIMNNDDSAQVQANITKYMAIIVAISLMVIVLPAKEVIKLMTTPEYYQAIAILPVLIFLGAIKVFTYIFQTGILYKKETRHLFTLSIIGCVAIIILNYFFISMMGLLGACIAKVLAATIVLVATNYISQKYYFVSYPYIQIFKVFLITVIFMSLGVSVNDLEYLYAIPIKIIIFIMMLLALYFSNILTMAEKKMAVNFVFSKFSKLGRT